MNLFILSENPEVDQDDKDLDLYMQLNNKYIKCSFYRKEYINGLYWYDISVPSYHVDSEGQLTEAKQPIEMVVKELYIKQE